MKPITEIAENLGLDTKEIIPYGHYKAKIPLSAKRDGSKRGKLVVVTGITPTPAGEGKTTTTVGLAQGFGKLNKNVLATLREPSLGPIFGIKGGGTGGGVSLVEPQDEVNIPTGCSIFPKEIVRPSERWIRKRFTNLCYYNELEIGGHFAAFEQPELYLQEIRTCFRSLR